jgi:leader peptidase (prepilin peptidase) / N-methyltransferase
MAIMLLWGLLGFAAGWLMNEVADAWPLDKPLGLPRCPQCSTPRVPAQWSGLAAYLLGQGRCRHCGRLIAWRWPLVELFSIIICLLLFHLIGPQPILPVVTLYSLILLLVCIIDFEHRLILNRVIYPAIAAAFALSFVTPGMTPLNAALGGLVGFALTGLIYLGGKAFVMLQARRGRIIEEVAFGQGDVWLMLFIGLITGVSGIVGALVYGILIGGVAALAIILIGALQRQSKLYVPYAYGPYLALAGWLILMQGVLIVPPA